MHISLDTNNQHLNTITAYQPGMIEVNRQPYTHSIIISPETLISPWEPNCLEELTSEHFAAILELKPQIFLLGVGATHQFPADKLLSLIYNAGISVEIMNTSAACRTYNILLAEDRNVVAALLIG